MSIEALHTTHTAGSGQIKVGGPGALANGLSLEGLNFFDIILANLLDKEGENTAVGEAAEPGDTLLTSGNNALLDKEPKLDLAKIIAENPEIAKQIENYSLDQNTALSEAIALNQKAFDDILKSIEDGTIVIEGLGTEEEGRTDIPQILETLFINGEVRGEDGEIKSEENIAGLLGDIDVGATTDEGGDLSKIRKILAAIERLLAAEEANPGFIATNLTPERIASIRSYYTRIQNFLNGGEGAPENGEIEGSPVAGVALGLIHIVPVDPKNRAEVATTLNQIEKPNHGSLISRLNALIRSGSTADTGTAPVEGQQAGTTSNQTEETPQAKFEHALDKASGQKADQAGNQNANAPQVKPNLSTLTSFTSALSGSLSAFGDWMSDLGLASTPAQVTDTANLTQLVTQAQHASRPHPAIQTIATHIQKSIGADGNRNITLQLDPPELGKVEVQMNFGKDKNVKITVVSEKPETFAMLQRDAQGLERILTDAGLDLEGGMNFELASHDHDFNHNGGHDGSRNGSGQPGENGDDSNLIESTMTWHVDPETGHMRYNLVV